MKERLELGSDLGIDLGRTLKVCSPENEHLLTVKERLELGSDLDIDLGRTLKVCSPEKTNIH